MKKIILTFLLLLFSFPALAHDEDSVYDRIMKSGKIRCGYIVWPPAFGKDPKTGGLYGINYDFIQEISRELKLELEWVSEIGIGEVAQALQTNKIDLMCASMWPDAQKYPQADFTRPTYFSAVFAYVRADDGRFDGNFEAINNPDITIGGIEGDITLDVGEKSFPKASFKPLPSMSNGSQLLLDLVSKKVDVIFIDDSLAINFEKANPGKIRRVKNVGPVRVFGEHLVLKRGETKLKEVLDITIESLVNSGVMERILKKYEGTFFAPKKTYEKSK
ncbi:MAG: transporter substrate-binding domain-containing protein [Alphaproteobacteria bacterium]|nr:transporter substrate-binding domain-containing protein [Alphaproteobacteria bacterium]